MKVRHSVDDAIVRVSNLTCAYGDTVIVDDISFDVARGEIFVILGGSGCGKSTVLKHLIGLYAPYHGQILIDGQDIGRASGAMLLEIQKRFGVMYQMGALFGSMSLLENVCLPLQEHTQLPPEAMDLIARMKLEQVGLAAYAHHLPSQISGGMQKRAAIARAMALDPGILFLDEPSAGLDPITSAGVDALIKQLSESLGVTFVIVTHELASIFAIAQRVIMLDKESKQIVAQGNPHDLKNDSTHPVVSAFFNRRPD